MIASFDERTERKPAQQSKSNRAASPEKAPDLSVGAVKDAIDEAGDESFPASDAPSWVPTIIGSPGHE